MKSPPPTSVREFSPHGLTFRLVFAICAVNIKAAALQVIGKVVLVSDVFIFYFIFFLDLR